MRRGSELLVKIDSTEFPSTGITLEGNRIGRGERGWPYSGYCGNGC